MAALVAANIIFIRRTKWVDLYYFEPWVSRWLKQSRWITERSNIKTTAKKVSMYFCYALKKMILLKISMMYSEYLKQVEQHTCCEIVHVCIARVCAQKQDTKELICCFQCYNHNLFHHPEVNI